MTDKKKTGGKVIPLRPGDEGPGEFELEHWKSRAKVAEAERDSAKRVLFKAREYFMNVEGVEIGAPIPEEVRLLKSVELLQELRLRLREHDQKYWTRDDATRALAEGIVDIKEGREPGKDK